MADAEERVTEHILDRLITPVSYACAERGYHPGEDRVRKNLANRVLAWCEKKAEKVYARNKPSHDPEFNPVYEVLGQIGRELEDYIWHDAKELFDYVADEIAEEMDAEGIDEDPGCGPAPSEYDWADDLCGLHGASVPRTVLDQQNGGKVSGKIELEYEPQYFSDPEMWEGRVLVTIDIEEGKVSDVDAHCYNDQSPRGHKASIGSVQETELARRIAEELSLTKPE